MPAHDHARNSRPGYSGRQGLSAGYNGRHDWDGRRGFDNVHFGPHRFVDPYASRGFSPGRGFYGNRYTRYRADRYFPPYGYRSYAWRRGDRLPVAYYAPRYIVRDYRAYHLGVPPLGYYWVRVNNDVLLTAITTGVVLQVVNDVFW
ncbi:MAG TPA: RcnB family protein [Steroidobacteraceae bacterium]|jgi:Ni/Co efflux regulator RcnB